MYRKLYDVLPAQVQPFAKNMYCRLYASLPPLPEDERRWKDVKKEYSKRSPTIIDGGAHKGETIEDLKNWFVSPKIHAFEPHPDNFELLQKRYGDDDSITLYNYAIGNEKGTMKLNVTRSTPGSSLLEPTEDYQSMWEGSVVEETVDVETRQLDEVLDEKVDILKLDLQGYEYFALQGATRLLQGVEIVTSETMFNINYLGQKEFDDLDELLCRNGFKLRNFYHIKHWPDGRARHADVVYIKD